MPYHRREAWRGSEWRREPSLPPPVLHPVAIPQRKEEAPCCAATRDEYGRYCIGWCGPDCERRP